MKKKTLQELTMKDNFMFSAVMLDENNCRPFLERVLGFPIAKIEVRKKYSLQCGNAGGSKSGVRETFSLLSWTN